MPCLILYSFCTMIQMILKAYNIFINTIVKKPIYITIFIDQQLALFNKLYPIAQYMHHYFNLNE